MKKDNERDERHEAYPRPTESDSQFNNQPEYTDQQPNEFHDKSVSDIPGSKADKQSNDPDDERK